MKFFSIFQGADTATKVEEPRKKIKILSNVVIKEAENLKADTEQNQK